MSLYLLLHKHLYGKIKWNLYKEIKQADNELILHQKDELAQALQEEQTVKFIDINWNNFKTNGHRYTFFDMEEGEQQEGAIYKFTSDITGDADLIEFLCSHIKKGSTKIYDMQFDYISISFEVMLFNAEKNNPYAIAQKRDEAIEKLRILTLDINTQAQLFKHELDHFIQEQIEQRYYFLTHQENFYKHIDKI